MNEPHRSAKVLALRADRARAPREQEPLRIEVALDRYLDSLYATARVLTADAAEAEDLVQETALTAIRKLADLRDPGALKPWLFRILHNTFMNMRRYRRRRPPAVDIDISAAVADPALLTEPAPPSGLSKDVGEALDALHVDLRAVLWVVDVEELTLAEAAGALGIPPGTAASRLHRARQQMRALLTGRKR